VARFLGIFFAALAVAAAPLVSRTAETPEVQMSGYAVASLVSTYRALHISTEADAPFALRDYIVVINKYGPCIGVKYGKPGSSEFRTVYTDGLTAKIVPYMPTGDYGGVILLPGIIAGEIIAVYSHALTGEGLASGGLSQIRNGAYNLLVDPGFGASGIVFIGLQSRPGIVSLGVSPTPTPRPGWTCIAGACEHQIATFRIKVTGGKVIIEHIGIL
jgi:hypothetical protein